MDPQLSVLLYSKYSQGSSQLAERIKKSGVDVSELLGLQELCVDNRDVRKRITESKEIAISTLPCILIAYADGRIDKFDGDSVFKLVDGVISANPPPLTDQEIAEIERRRQDQEIAHARSEAAAETALLEDAKKALEEENKRLKDFNRRSFQARRGGSIPPGEPELKPGMIPDGDPTTDSFGAQLAGSSFTSIMDLDDEAQEASTIVVDPSGMGGQGSKKSAKSRSLLDAAQRMAKSRE